MAVNLYFPFATLESAGSFEPLHRLGLFPLKLSQNAGREETVISVLRGQQRDHNVTWFRNHCAKQF